MIQILAEPQVNMFTGAVDHTITKPVKASSLEIEKYKEWYRTRNTQDNRLDLAIEVNNKVIGEVVLNLFDSTHQSCNIRILISDAATGHGVGSSAMSLVIDYAFAKLGLKSITLDVFEFNLRALVVYQKLGFQEDQVQNLNPVIFDGKEYRDIKMSLTPNKFKKLS